MNEQQMIKTNMLGYTMLLLGLIAIVGMIFPPMLALLFFVPRLRRRRLLKLVERRTASYRLHAQAERFNVLVHGEPNPWGNRRRRR